MNSQTLILKVTDMAFGGKGVARHEGKVYFVDGALAGDTVRALIEHDKKKFAEARAIEIIEPSPDRREVLCKHQSLCGGCRLMPGRYEKQLEWKQSFVVSALERIGKFDDLPVPQMIASPIEYAYRNRIFLRARLTHTHLTLGYTGLDHQSLLAIESCAIAEDAINRGIALLLKHKYPATEKNLEFRMQIQRFETESQEEIVSISIYPSGAPKDRLQKFMDIVKNLLPTAWVGFANEAKDAPAFIYDHAANIKSYSKPGIFQQVNRPANRLVLDIIQKLTLEINPKSVLDLCCGSGNLSLQLAKSGMAVFGSESNPLSIELANLNLEKNQIPNAQYEREDANKLVQRLLKEKKTFDLILVDPPREGLKEAMKDIVAIGAKDIFYLSCEPSTLARDLAILANEKPHRMKSIYCFDFFPHTWHVETLVHLSV